MKKFLKNPWVVGIGTTVVGGVLLTFVLDLIQGVDWLSTLKSVIQFTLKILTAFLNFELKAWWLLVFIALIVVILSILSKILDAKDKSKPVPFLSYTKDYLLEYTWEWEYRKIDDGKYNIVNLHPVCSKCGMLLRPEYTMYGIDMKCLRCNTSQSWEDHYLIDAQMLIADNIKKKNYPQYRYAHSPIPESKTLRCTSKHRI